MSYTCTVVNIIFSIVEQYPQILVESLMCTAMCLTAYSSCAQHRWCITPGSNILYAEYLSVTTTPSNLSIHTPITYAPRLLFMINAVFFFVCDCPRPNHQSIQYVRGLINIDKQGLHNHVCYCFCLCFHYI